MCGQAWQNTRFGWRSTTTHLKFKGCSETWHERCMGATATHRSRIAPIAIHELAASHVKPHFASGRLQAQEEDQRGMHLQTGECVHLPESSLPFLQLKQDGQEPQL